MSLVKLISNYASFNLWANKEITDWLVTLEHDLLISETPSSFNTIQKTLEHIDVAQMFWLDFITDRDVSNFQWSTKARGLKSTIDSLSLSSSQMQDAFTTFGESQLIEHLHLKMPWAKNTLSRYEYIMHVINHGTFHRGQIITMARALGVQEGFPKTDLNIFNATC